MRLTRHPQFQISLARLSLQLSHSAIRLVQVGDSPIGMSNLDASTQPSPHQLPHLAQPLRNRPQSRPRNHPANGWSPPCRPTPPGRGRLAGASIGGPGARGEETGEGPGLLVPVVEHPHLGFISLGPPQRDQIAEHGTARRRSASGRLCQRKARSAAMKPASSPGPSGGVQFSVSFSTGRFPIASPLRPRSRQRSTGRCGPLRSAGI